MIFYALLTPRSEIYAKAKHKTQLILLNLLAQALYFSAIDKLNL